MIVEIIATSVEDALRIERGGAQRIELISGLAEGGVTPSAGLIRAVCRRVNIPVMAMIRPHAMNFCYEAADLAVMIEDIGIARDGGATGVVLGCLTYTKCIDEKVLEKLLRAADGLEVTFHRAIDDTPDVLASIATLRNYPITRVLTSGGPGKAQDNIPVIQAMRAATKGAFSILAGSGMNAGNAARLIAATGVREVHFGTAARIAGAIDQLVAVDKVREIVDNAK